MQQNLRTTAVVTVRIPDRVTLRRAAHAVDTAVHELHADPTSPAVTRALQRASGAVAQLPAGLVATTMRRLLDTIAECHRAGRETSARLVAQRGAAVRAVRLAG